MTPQKSHIDISIPVPKLFQRGKKNIFYIRMRDANNDDWISLKTTDYKKALIEAQRIVNKQYSIELINREEINKSKRDEKINKVLQEKHHVSNPVEIKLTDAHELWVAHTRSHSNLSTRTKGYYATIFKRFVDWCAEQDINNIHSVSQSMVERYAKKLWDGQISGKTYNDHLKHLSRVFAKIDSTISPLPYRNPFDFKLITRIEKAEMGEIGHEALESDMLRAVIKQASKKNKDFRDLIILGSQTGLRLVDAVFLEWSSLSDNFIELVPRKTSRKGNTCKIPITPTLKTILKNRSTEGKSGYVLKKLADHYTNNSSYVSQTCKKFFDAAFKEAGGTLSLKGHRKRRASKYSFASLRTTFMSLLATEDVSTRDAKRIMGWKSQEMIQIYERMLEKAKKQYEERALALVKKVPEFDLDIPEVNLELTPTKEALASLVKQYSNITIGKIYGISEAAIRKQIKKHCIVRGKRIESADVTGGQLSVIRKKLIRGTV